MPPLVNHGAVPLDPTCCPADREEVAEAYIMEALSAEDSAAFEEHIIGCRRCLGTVEHEAMTAEIIREAAREFSTNKRASPPAQC